MSAKKFEDEELRKLIDEGLLVKDIADRLGVTYAAVRKRAWKIGVNPKRAECYWTDEEMQTIIDEYKSRKDLDMIAKKLGRSRYAVQSKLYSMIYSGVTKNPVVMKTKERKILQFVHLNQEEIEDLVRMAAEGNTAKEIAEYLGVTEGAIYIRAKKMGIVVRREKPRWNDDEDEILADMFNRGCKAGYIAERLGKSKPSILARAFRLREKGILGYHQHARTIGSHKKAV